MAKKFLTPITPPSLSSDPATGVTGAIYFNTQINKLKVYNGTSWVDLSQSNDLSTLSIQEVNTGGTAVETYGNISTLQFDQDSGFDVTSPSAGVAKVAMNSTFKYWQINGSPALEATGLDTVNFIAGNGISISANSASNPKSFTISSSSSSASSIQALNQAPASPARGDIYFDIQENTIKFYNGTIWHDVGGPKSLLDHQHYSEDGLVRHVDYGQYVSELNYVVSMDGGTASTVYASAPNNDIIDGGSA